MNLYTAMEIAMAEQYSKIFEAKFPGISVRVERSGAERIFSRIAQEYASRIFNVDLVNTTDAAHVLAWKREGWLAPYLPADAAQHYRSGASSIPTAPSRRMRILFSVIAYNTQLVKPQDAPTGFVDLLDPKWTGKLVKAHPGYSGLILTATHAMARDLGWGYFEKLGRQKVMQVQSGVDPPKKVALGERAAMVDGADYIAFQQKDKGAPIEVVYPAEGAPLINSPNAVFKAAPNPNAARLFQNWMCSGEGQQALVDLSAQYVPHTRSQAPARTPAARRHQVHEGRSRDRPHPGRRDQGQVHGHLQGVTSRASQDAHVLVHPRVSVSVRVPRIVDLGRNDHDAPVPHAALGDDALGEAVDLGDRPSQQRRPPCSCRGRARRAWWRSRGRGGRGRRWRAVWAGRAFPGRRRR